MPSDSDQAELTKLARVHSNIENAAKAPPGGAYRLNVHKAHVAAAKRVIENRMREIIEKSSKEQD